MENQEKKEFGQEIHNQIIGWTENCDTKASIMIAFVGIFVSVLFTSDYILRSIQNIFTPIVQLFKGDVGCFDIIAFFVIIFLLGSFFFIGWAILLLINTLRGKISYKGNASKSLIFFQSIQNYKSYEEYLEKIESIDEEELQKDKFEQIYICARICAGKFKDYNKAISKIKWGLLFFCLFIFTLFVYNS